MTRNALQIKTDGSMSTLDLDAPEGAHKTLSNGVGGYIEAVAFGSFNMYVNEEGKVMDPPLPWNRYATMLVDIEFGIGADTILGDVVLTGLISDDGDDTEFPPGIEKIVRHLVESGYTA